MRNGIYQLSDMIGSSEIAASRDGIKWFRAVPMPFYPGITGRFRGALSVFLGRSYATTWPELGDLEGALRDAGGGE